MTQFRDYHWLLCLCLYECTSPGVPHTVAKLAYGYYILHFGYKSLDCMSSHFCHYFLNNPLRLALAILGNGYKSL